MIQATFQQLCQTPSDINEHLETLAYYAKGLHCVEFGVRGVVSTWAFLAAPCASLISVDLYPCPVEAVELAAQEAGIPFEFWQADTLTLEPIACELLFIDTLHTGEQLQAELQRHAGSVSQYLVFHDTVTFGRVGEHGQEGLLRALDEFRARHPEWQLVEDRQNNNGLLVLGKL